MHLGRYNAHLLLLSNRPGTADRDHVHKLRNAQRRSLVIARLQVTLIAGSFPHVALHAKSPGEIAVSVLAEIVQLQAQLS